MSEKPKFPTALRTYEKGEGREKFVGSCYDSGFREERVGGLSVRIPGPHPSPALHHSVSLV